MNDEPIAATRGNVAENIRVGLDHRYVSCEHGAEVEQE